MIGEAFATDLLGAVPLPDRMNELNPLDVDAPQHRRSGQESRRPVMIRSEETKESSPLREPRKQRPIVARQPPIKRAVAPAFEVMQDPQGHYVTWLQGGVGMFGDAWEMVIHLAE